MTELRRRYIRDLVIRGKAERTQESYIRYVADLARHYGRSPECISYEEAADWLYHLVHERRLSPSTVNVAVNAVRFLYRVTLGREVDELEAKVPHCKRPTQRAQAYSVEEVEAILKAARRSRDRAFLMTVYSAGLRVTEACTLRVPGSIDRARMQLRVDGKGAKERVLPLSPRVLEELERYWREERRGRLGERAPWLFIALDRESHLGSTGGQYIYYRALKRSGVRQRVASTSCDIPLPPT
jgi:integrase/recombinase XerD